MTTDLNGWANRIPIVVAFTIHLLVPLALSLDVVESWKVFGVMNSTDKAVLAFSAVWLPLGIGELLISTGVNRYQTSIGKSLLTIYSVCLSFALLELSAHVFMKKSQPTLFSPGTKYVARTYSGLMHGIEGPANVSINDVGFKSNRTQTSHRLAWRYGE